MVFSTISAYLDPANWQQQPNYQTGNTGPIPPPPPPPPPPQPHGAGDAGSIRPGSMADRARMPNIPMPETALKCPRCESTNTKFCYFNNYSLSQPRHFCKTCKRYWTRGGALRSVPVGGGCRRNKRSSKATSSNTSKSPSNSETAANSGSTTSYTLPSNNNNNILAGLTSEISQLPFMAPSSHYGPEETGTNYGGISAPVGAPTSDMNFQIGSNLFGGGGGGGVGSFLSSGGGVEPWRLQQGQGQGQGQQFIPNFLGGFDPTTQGGILYPNYYQGSGGYVGAKLSNSSMLSQALAKMEVSKNTNGNNNNQDCHESNLGRAQFLGSVEGGSDHQWNNSGTAAWTDLSGFNSSSTSNRS